MCNLMSFCVCVFFLKDSKEFSQQLHVCQQKVQTLLQELEETQCHCDALTRELDATKMQMKDKVKSECHRILFDVG